MIQNYYVIENFDAIKVVMDVFILHTQIQIATLLLARLFNKLISPVEQLELDQFLLLMVLH